MMQIENEDGKKNNFLIGCDERWFICKTYEAP